MFSELQAITQGLSVTAGSTIPSVKLGRISLHFTNIAPLSPPGGYNPDWDCVRAHPVCGNAFPVGQFTLTSFEGKMSRVITSVNLAEISIAGPHCALQTVASLAVRIQAAIRSSTVVLLATLSNRGRGYCQRHLSTRNRSCLLLLGLITALHTSPTVAAERSNGEINETELSLSDRNHWSFRPVQQPKLPEVKQTTWPKNAVDTFLLSNLESAGLQPAPDADRLTYLRRVTFSLTGLPPTIDEQQSFLNDLSPDAHSRLVDRLLSTPAYGERWAQHWLDIARFAETDGYEHDLIRPNAWKFRDWVVQALNSDLPYDEFVRQQIAGDILYPQDPGARIATGWLLCGPDMPDINSQDERRNSILNEITGSFAAVFLSLQMGCAQCHDHKFDPVSQADFYRLRACFDSLDIFRDHPVATAEELALQETERQLRGTASRELERQLVELNELARRRIREKNPDLEPGKQDVLDALSQPERERFHELTRQLSALPPLTKLPEGRVVKEGKRTVSHLLIRGDYRRRGPEVSPAVPRILAYQGFEAPAFAEAEAARVTLAKWLTRPDHPLTARVIVNRVWLAHFGEGLVTTPNDFGKMGDEPIQQELLDWLAAELPRQGWSLKWLHRLLLTSATYRQASRASDATDSLDGFASSPEAWKSGLTQDPENRLWGRMPRQRLDGESIRDAMLTLSDRLNRQTGGPGIRPHLPQEMLSTLLKNQWVVSSDPTSHHRRSLYLFVRRNLRFPLLEAFDKPDTNSSCPKRNRSTIAPQALILLNSEESLNVAREFCGILLQSAPNDTEKQIKLAYQLALGRAVHDHELTIGKTFLESEAAHLASTQAAPSTLAVPDFNSANASKYHAAALTSYCLALINLNEFVYVD